MIDLKTLRERPDHFRTGIARKNGDPAIVDRLLQADQQLRALLTEDQALTAEKNAIGKQIGQLAGQLKKADDHQRPALQEKMTALQARPNEIKPLQESLVPRLRELEAARDALWLDIPQPADDDVPVGRNADDNVELNRWNPPAFDPAKTFEDNKGFAPKSHLELCHDLGLVDFERGIKVAGARSYVLVGDGMRLHQAVLRFAFDFMTIENGFTPLSASCIVRHPTLVGTGFFPHGRDQVYDIANPTSEEGLALTGTGEVGLMAYHTDEILPPEDLPRCYTTVSTCFRREAGAAGKDTAGLYRIHQFDKVEQVVICEADEQISRDWHQKMIGFVEELLKRLELPHRQLHCCTGDLGPKNADMIDLECWMPSRAPGKAAAAPGEKDTPQATSSGWGETHSASRLYDYQTRRLNLRYRDRADPKGKRTLFCHSLNNTVAASPRLLIPLMEIHQTPAGTIRIPEALQPYLNGDTEIGTR